MVFGGLFSTWLHVMTQTPIIANGSPAAVAPEPSSFGRSLSKPPAVNIREHDLRAEEVGGIFRVARRDVLQRKPLRGAGIEESFENDDAPG